MMCVHVCVNEQSLQDTVITLEFQVLSAVGNTCVGIVIAVFGVCGDCAICVFFDPRTSLLAL